MVAVGKLLRCRVSIRAPRVRGDANNFGGAAFTRCFNPRPSCEGRPVAAGEGEEGDEVSIRAPRVRGDHY